MLVFFFKQKTADEMRISDWSSDVCSSDLCAVAEHRRHEMRPGEGRGEACRKVGRIAEARVISLMAEDKADRDVLLAQRVDPSADQRDRKSTRLNSSH